MASHSPPRRSCAAPQQQNSLNFSFLLSSGNTRHDIKWQRQWIRPSFRWEKKEDEDGAPHKRRLRYKRLSLDKPIKYFGPSDIIGDGYIGTVRWSLSSVEIERGWRTRARVVTAHERTRNITTFSIGADRRRRQPIWKAQKGRGGVYTHTHTR